MSTTLPNPDATARPRPRLGRRGRFVVRWVLLGLAMFAFSLGVAVATVLMADRAEGFARREREERAGLARAREFLVQAERDARAAELRGALAEADRLTRLAADRRKVVEYRLALVDKYRAARNAPWSLIPPDPPRPRVPPGTITDPARLPFRGPGLGPPRLSSAR
ncbi:MAG: hypothetical protein U0835_18270 [Isosphaeraceae bacterium]